MWIRWIRIRLRIRNTAHEMDLALDDLYRYALTGKKYVNGSVNSEGHYICHQKPNKARETVPLKGPSCQIRSA
jgi:hypothetical protein